MLRFLNRILVSSSGATAIEYALIAALIFLAIVASVHYLGNSVGNNYNYTTQKVGDAVKH